MQPESPVVPGPSSKRARHTVQDDIHGSVSEIESSCKISEPKIRLNDLTVLYDPPTDSHPVIADVIFVHGLQGHPQKTWQSTAQSPIREWSIFGVSSFLRAKSFISFTKLSQNMGLVAKYGLFLLCQTHLH